MQPSVRGENLIQVDREWPALEIRRASSGFLKNDPAGCGVPRLKIQFPESVQPARGDIRKVQGGRTAAPHSLAGDQKVSELVNHGVQALAEVVRKSSNQ